MIDDDVLTMVRRADPLDPAELDGWVQSEAPARIAAEIIGGSRSATPRRRRRVVALTVAGVVVTSMGAAAAAGLLGRPAPERVKAHLAELDRGLPADLRADPNLDQVRAVAESRSATLFAADTADGGYCIEVVTGDDTPRGASCVSRARLASQRIEVTSPIVRDDEPVILAGRVDIADRSALRVVHADGSSDDIAVTSDGYWIIELTGAHRQSALSAGVGLRAVGADGGSTAEITVPPLADSPPPEGAGSAIEVTTVSDGDDLTLVLGVEGRVRQPGVVAVELTYPDGTVASIPVGPDGGFSYTLPTGRQRDLADVPARLEARDGRGAVVAVARVASVAYWHRQNG